MRNLDRATKQLLMDQEKRRAWVIYQLRLRGQSLASLARDHGYERSAPRVALKRPWEKMERLLADALDVPVHVLFPERYSRHGDRLVRMGRPKKYVHKRKDNTRVQSRNVDVGAAA